DRAELYADDRTRRPISFHDLRATGITWRVVRGDPGEAIMEQAGRTDFATTRGDIRTARALRASFGGPFPPVSACLLEGFVTGSVTPEGLDGETIRERECEEGESNPYTFRYRNLNPARLPVPPSSRGRRRDLSTTLRSRRQRDTV